MPIASLSIRPPQGLRLFGLADWTISRFVERRTRLHALQYEATRLREKPMVWSSAAGAWGNVAVFWSLAGAVASGTLSLGPAIVFAQSALGASLIAFGGLNWALDGSSAQWQRCCAWSRRWLPPVRYLPARVKQQACRRARFAFHDLTFAYPGGSPVLDHLDLTILPVPRWRLSDRTERQDDSGKTALPLIRSTIGWHSG